MQEEHKLFGAYRKRGLSVFKDVSLTMSTALVVVACFAVTMPSSDTVGSIFGLILTEQQTNPDS